MSSLEETQPMEATTWTLKPESVIVKDMSTLQLSQRKIAELDKRTTGRDRPTLKATPRNTQSQSPRQVTDSHVVKCQCGWSGEDDDMVGGCFFYR